MLSYHADMDINTNPYELGLDRLINLDMEANFIGKAALRRIREKGVDRKQVGMIIDGGPLENPNTTHWPVMLDDRKIGHITSAIYSPRLAQNIALAMVETRFAELGTAAKVGTPEGERDVKVVPRPFFDPAKKLASGVSGSGKS